MIENEYAYYSGCSLEGTATEYNESLKAILKEIKIDFREPDDWSCCGSTPAHTVNHVLSSALAARNLSLIEKTGLKTVITPCPSCMMAFKKAQHRMSESESFKNEVNEILDNPYECGVEAKSALQIFVEDIGLETITQYVTHVMPDLKVAPYYGCILNRPPEIAKFDNPENPVAMDNILSAAKVNVCDFAFKVECCGAAYGVTKRKMVNELSYKVLSMAVDAGANCIAVACPLCHQNLDLRQGQINETMGSNFNIPILYFTQIIGLAFGMSPKQLQLEKLVVNSDHLVRSRITVAEHDKMRAEAEAQAKAKRAAKKTVKEEAKTEEKK